jgi:hypothetical protein
MRIRLRTLLIPTLWISIPAIFCTELLSQAFGRNYQNALTGAAIGGAAGLLGWIAWQFDVSRYPPD